MDGNERILAKAAEIEGHADNAAASLLGALTVCSRSSKSRAIVTQKLIWPSEWATIVCVPSYVLSTKKARAVLPKQLSYFDAVHNLQKLGLFLAAVQNRDEEAMQEALHDRLHEPYRSELVPNLGAIRRLVSDLPVIGCVLSGAGPSVLTVVHQRHRQQLFASLSEWQQKHDSAGEVLDLSVDQEGLKLSYE
jgi:homoserine kinase